MGGIFLNNSVETQYNHDIHTKNPLAAAINNDEYLYLWDGGNLGNMRLDIADTAMTDATNNLMIGVSYTYDCELNNMN